MKRRVSPLTVVLALSLPFFWTPLRPVSPARAGELARTYREPAQALMEKAMSSRVAYDRLEQLCDSIGNRLSGTPQLEEAGRWARALMEEDGFVTRLEPVQVPVWVRGEESATLLSPREVELSMLGLGNSVGTGPEGITADVVVVSDYDGLEALGRDGVQGKIVLYDAPFVSYGQTVTYRTAGPSRASALGAVASLCRSIGPVSLDTPHTGMLYYEGEAPQIPGAALSLEHATLLHRLYDAGEPVRVNLRMDAHFEANAPSNNVVGELKGTDLAQEIVVVGGHLDSWDVGQGAQDDGVGCLIAWEAARLINELGLKPRRTIRVVLFANEENGLAGGKQYAVDHAGELANHVAALESDSGNGLARGFEVDVEAPLPEGADAQAKEAAKKAAAVVRDRIMPTLADIASLLAPLHMDGLHPGGAGADVSRIVASGTLGLGLNHDTTKYFEIHHTEADTFDKIVLEDMQKNVAAMAVMLYVLADMPERPLPVGSW